MIENFPIVTPKLKKQCTLKKDLKAEFVFTRTKI